MVLDKRFLFVMKEYNHLKDNRLVLSEAILDESRKAGDKSADELVDTFIGSDKMESLYFLMRSNSWSEAEEAVRDNVPLKRFLENDVSLPSWADPENMEEAAKLFRSNGNEFLFLLGIVSLPYCYAAANGALSLYHTEKIRKNTEARLLDTTGFILYIKKSGAFNEGGSGFLAIKKVRLQHALARYYLSKVPEIIRLNEVPINQEDMLGTNLAFSYMALQTLPKVGVYISRDLENSYIHFWSVIGFLLGIPENLLPKNMNDAYYLEKLISDRQFRHSKEGEELTNNLLDYYISNIPNKATVRLIRPLIQYMLGDKVSQILRLSNGNTRMPVHFIMSLLPLFKRFVFPPVQSFDVIVRQFELRKTKSSVDRVSLGK